MARCCGSRSSSWCSRPRTRRSAGRWTTSSPRSASWNDAARRSSATRSSNRTCMASGPRRTAPGLPGSRTPTATSCRSPSSPDTTGGMRRLLILCALLIASACAPAPSTPQSTVIPSPQAATSVKWIWTAVSGVSAGTWTAIDAGYFTEEGLNVEPVHIASSSRAVPALIANEAQFSNLDGNVLVQASLQGADVVGLLAQTNRLVFSVMADPSVADGPALKGKRLGITRTGSSTHTAALQALALWKLEPNTDVTLLELSEVPSILAGLQAKQIEAGV